MSSRAESFLIGGAAGLLSWSVALQASCRAPGGWNQGAPQDPGCTDLRERLRLPQPRAQEHSSTALGPHTQLVTPVVA